MKRTESNRKMEFEILATILIFCAAAAFTLVDVGSDGMLIDEYRNKYLNPPVVYNASRWIYRRDINTSYWRNDPQQTYLNPPVYFNECSTTPFKNDTELHYISCQYADPYFQFLFLCLTTSWVALGGLCQFSIVVSLFVRRHPSLELFGKPAQILLLCSSAILMGPVFVGVYGAVFVFINANKVNIKEDIEK